jgi:hypothetical protein
MIHARADYNRIQDPEGKIGEDEPVFLLRAKDVCAPGAVAAWANAAERMGCSPEIVELARRWAATMTVWQDENGMKRADL